MPRCLKARPSVGPTPNSSHIAFSDLNLKAETRRCSGSLDGMRTLHRAGGDSACLCHYAAHATAQARAGWGRHVAPLDCLALVQRPPRPAPAGPGESRRIRVIR